MDVIEPFKGIFYLSRVFGVFPFRLKKSKGVFVFEESRGMLLCTKCLLTIYLSAQVYLLWHQVVVETKLFPEESLKTAYAVGSFTTGLSSAAIFRAMMVDKSRLGFWMNNINKMFSNVKGDRLRKLNVSLWVSLSFTATFLIVSFAFEMSIVHMYEKQIGSPRTFFHKLYVATFLFYLSVWQIKLFMQIFLLCVHLLRLSYEETRKTMTAPASKRQKRFWLQWLLSLRVKDLVLKDFLDFLHYFFVPVACLQLLWGFANLLLNIMIAASVGVPLTIKLGWVGYLSIDIYLLVATCHAAEKEGNQIPHHVQELFINWDDEEISNEVEICSLQLQHKKIEFTALGFHKMDFSLLYAMIGSLTSSAVVIVQFRHDSDAKGHCTELIRNFSLVLGRQNGGVPAQG